MATKNKEKKDYCVYHNLLSDHVSTRQLGDQEEFITETTHMLRQILTKTDYISTYRPMKNCNLYSDPDSERTKAPELEFCTSPYITTHQVDYRNPNPTSMKPVVLPSVPFLLNREIYSNLTQNYGAAPPAGEYQFLDAHTPIDHIRAMKWSRHQSFNPNTCTRDFPTVVGPQPEG